MREVVHSSRFARFDLLVVIVSGIAWLLWLDHVGAAPLLLLFLPWMLRLFAKVIPFQRTPFDWLMVVFLVTTWIGYWSSYDEASALNKAWLITASIFLFYALSAQPKENILWITSGLFMIGVGVSAYFFLTHNFIDDPRKFDSFNKIGVLWTNIRPQLPWLPIHPNYVSGLAALTAIFGFYPLQKCNRINLVKVSILAGFGVVLSALVMATSRGVWMAIASAVGVWILWRIVNLNGIKPRLGNEAFFPTLVLIYLCVAVVIIYVGPATFGSATHGSPYYGTGSREELFIRSLYFLGDFPILGGGLASFPGLYSQYVLDIPYFYVTNSHNLFLDVSIEQGLFGGVAFFLFYTACLWRVSKAIARAHSPEIQLFRWLTLCALVIAVVHGMVDDYLYNGKDAFLSVFLIGLAMIVIRDDQQNQTADKNIRQDTGWIRSINGRKLTLVFIVGLVVFVGINYGKIRAIWYANLGAVQMAKVELAGFPETRWAGPAMTAKLDQAEASLHTALGLDPFNRTANHRLGLISMLRWDFSSAVGFLTIAHDKAPQHRGIIKSLEFSYAWLGDTEKAQSMSKDIPEAKSEFDLYSSWWKEQGREDLSEYASIMSTKLEFLPSQH